MSQVVVPQRVYLRTGGLLLALLVVTVAVGRLNLGTFNILIAMIIAAVKAVLVALFFMHLRYRRPVVGLFAAAGLIWFTIMISLTLVDFLHRGWLGTGVP
jgi:cytochrome c oxidase subunit IV